MVAGVLLARVEIAGLAVCLATCLLIMLYILDERSYDQYQQDGDNIYRIASVNNKGETWVPLAAVVKAELPEVEQVTGLMTFPDIAKMLMKYEDGSQKKQFFESNGYYVDVTFFQVLTYGMSALFITLITVSSQAVKTALVNPAKSLKME